MMARGNLDVFGFRVSKFDASVAVSESISSQAARALERGCESVKS